LAKRSRPTRIVELTNAEYWLPEVSRTFHGRDILSPVAAQLSLGLEPERLGPVTDQLQMLDWPEPSRSANRIEGRVLWIDHFGNAITNITSGMLAGGGSNRVRIHCAGREITDLVNVYGNRKQGELVAQIGSSGHLELAVVNGSAGKMLRIESGAPVAVEW
jgi:S-adenosylmethionine hydrolase